MQLFCSLWLFSCISGKDFNMFYTDFLGGICDLHTFSSSVRSGLLFHFLNNFFCRIDVKFNETEFSSFRSPPHFWILFLVLYLRKL